LLISHHSLYQHYFPYFLLLLKQQIEEVHFQPMPTLADVVGMVALPLSGLIGLSFQILLLSLLQLINFR
jgi:hypothetical protein